MRSIKIFTKFATVAVLLTLAFGPIGAVQQTPVAHAQSCPTGTSPLTVGVLSGKCVKPDGTVVDASGASVDLNKTFGGSSTDCTGVTSCLANMVYYIGPGLASWVVSWAAYFFDYSVRIALNSTAYALEFLTSGWTLVLSLANMFFIFILIYAAFTIMLRAETARTMQTLAWVVAIALVVNFSFFFTRVVIDAGNILAVQFYNQVVTLNNNQTLQSDSGTTDPNAPADLTANIMKAVGVHELLGTQSFNTVQQALGGNAAWSTLLVLTVLYLAVAIMFWILALSLLMVGVKFFIRVVGLWFILVFSPLAFVAQTLSNTRPLFEKWLRMLVGFSLYPAVFLFMFYILNLFVGDLTRGTSGSIIGSIFPTAAGAAAGDAAAPYTTLTAIANVSVRMMFIVAMLYIMLKVADWVIEQTGGMAATILNRGGSALLGAGFRTAANVGAFAGRNTVGRGALALSQSAGLKNLAANSRLGSALWRGTSALSRSTYDARNAPGAGVVGRAASTVLGNINVGRGSQRSADQGAERRAKRAEEKEVQSQQAEFIDQYEKKNGKGSYTSRVAELQKRAGDFRTTAQQAKQEALIEPGLASRLQQVAKFNEEAAKRTAAELGALTSVGKSAVDAKAKARVAELTQRLGNKPGATLIMPAQKEPGTPRDMSPELREMSEQQRETNKLLREMTQQDKESASHINLSLHAIPEAMSHLEKKVEGQADKKLENSEGPGNIPASTAAHPQQPPQKHDDSPGAQKAA